MTGHPEHPDPKPKSLMEDPAQDSDRRSNVELRELIDQMLQRVREIHRNNPRWDSSERARAEADLESIMARVRRETVRSGLDEEASTDAASRNSGNESVR
ncbi:MAG: hypothetical protein H7Z74_06145 [Anaerolineae bacterium]|nr:hypothetical protein [Gemmatimonadaceae bacterium]